jgi:hypothetical protein
MLKKIITDKVDSYFPGINCFVCVCNIYNYVRQNPPTHLFDFWDTANIVNAHMLSWKSSDVVV